MVSSVDSGRKVDFLRNNSEHIVKILQKINWSEKNYYLVSFDVGNLYTNLP